MLTELLENAGYETRSYSGRGMYGKECLSIVTDDNLAEVICNLIDADHHAAFGYTDILRSTKEDHMGRSMVYYWPNVAYGE